MFEEIERLIAEADVQGNPLLDAYNRLAAEIAAREAAEQAGGYLAAVMESTEVAFVSKTLDGIVVSWNAGAEDLFGFRSEEMIGESITRILPDGCLHEETEILTRLQRGERIEHYESIRRRKEGTLFPVSLTISPVRDRNGEIVGGSKIARDLSEHRQLEIQAGQIADLQKALAELRNLNGLLPMCAWCMKVRDEDGHWETFESYLHAYTGADVTHGICPDCMEQQMHGLPRH